MNDSTKKILLCGIIAAVTFLIFSPVLHADFLQWDDAAYLKENPWLAPLAWKTVVGMFTHFHFFSYTPVALLSHSLDFAAWGMDPRGHHLTSVLLHSLNTALLFFLALAVFSVFRRKDWTGGPQDEGALTAPVLIGAAVAALVFGLHPLRVESVTCIADRKDLLSFLFLIPATTIFIRRMGSETRWISTHYIVMCVLFALALLAKSTAMVWPVLLVLFEIVVMRPAKLTAYVSLVRTKIPFFVLAGLTAWAAARSAPLAIQNEMTKSFTLFEKLALPFSNYLFYWEKFFLPVQLTVMYIPSDGTVLFVRAGIFLVVSVATLILWHFRQRALVLVWWCGFIGLLPVLGVVPSGIQVLADRYTYIPFVGIALVLGAVFAWAWEFPRKEIRIAVVVLYIAVLSTWSLITINNTDMWSNSDSLWSRAVNLYPKNFLAWNNLGTANFERGRTDAALRAYQRALEIKPDFSYALYNIANLNYTMKNYEKAETQIRYYLARSPDYVLGWTLLGNISLAKGNFAGAKESFARGRDLQPNDASGYINLGVYFDRVEQTDSAVIMYRKAVELNPRSSIGMLNLGLCEEKLGNDQRAMEFYAKAIANDTTNGDAYYAMGVAVSRTERRDDAWDYFLSAARHGNKQALDLLKRIP